MSSKATPFEVKRSLLIQAPPARVLAAFFDRKDLACWWQVVRAVTVARPLGMYAIEWDTTPFTDEVLGHLGGTLHGTIIDYRPNASFFIAEAYWQPPEGEPIGPMALDVHCRPHGNGRSTMLTVRQSGEGEGSRWHRYFEIMGYGWEGALLELKDHMDREAARTKKLEPDGRS